MNNPKKQYSKRKDYYEKLYNKQIQTINFISVIRFITFIFGIVFTLVFLNKNMYYLSFSIFTAALILFIILVVKHSTLKGRKKCTSILCNINKNSIKRLNGEWKSFNDTGEEFIDDNHSYSKDLDIFGKNSLFQWINTACTYIGRKKLKEVLESPSLCTDEINKRQAAIKELASNIGWRQRFNAEGLMISDEIQNPDELIKWGMD